MMISFLTVSLLVIPQSAKSIKPRTTSRALILSVVFVMNYEMFSDWWWINECSVTTWFGTLVVSDVKVTVDVPSQLTRLREGFRTIWAVVFLQARVNQHVHLNALHYLPTNTTLRAFTLVRLPGFIAQVFHSFHFWIFFVFFGHCRLFFLWHSTNFNLRILVKAISSNCLHHFKFLFHLHQDFCILVTLFLENVKIFDLFQANFTNVDEF